MDTKYDLLLLKFVSNDEIRPKLMNPCQIGDYVFASDGFASDGHALIRIPASLCGLDYKQEYEFYKVDHLFEQEHNCAQVIDFHLIEKWAETAPKTSVFAPCPTCDGDGTIHCSYCRNDHECPDCNGYGNGKKIGEEVSGAAGYKINNVKFGYKNLQRLVLASKNLDAPAKWVYREKDKGCLFQVGEISILLMPMMGD